MAATGRASVATSSGWISGSHAKELERLNQLLWHYETENLDQKQHLENFQIARDTYLQRVQQLQHDAKRLEKRIKNLEIQLKYEKVACDGLRKKSGLLEKEKIDLAEEKERLSQQYHYIHDKYVEADHSLQEERSFRLQLVHEKETLTQEVTLLAKKNHELETENNTLHNKFLASLQEKETLVHKVHQESVLVKHQTHELATIYQEQASSLRQQQSLSIQLLEEHGNHNKFHQMMDSMQQEISYLRATIAQLTASPQQGINNNNHNNKTKTDLIGIHNYDPKMSDVKNNNRLLVNYYTAQRYDDSSFRIAGTFTTQRRAEEANRKTIYDDHHHQQPLLPSMQQKKKVNNSSVISPLATRGHTPANALAFSNSAFSIGGDNEDDNYFNNPQRRELLQWIRTASSRGASRTVSGNNNNNSRLGTAISGSTPNNKLTATTASADFNLFTITNNSDDLTLLQKDSNNNINRLNQTWSNSLSAVYNNSSINSPPDDHNSSNKKKTANKNKQQPQHASSTSNLSSLLQSGDVNRRTLYVGQGMHYQHDQQLEQELQKLQHPGSTKHILAGILDAR